MAWDRDIGIDRDYRDAWGNMCSAPEATVARLEGVLQRSALDGAAVESPSSDEERRCFDPEWMARGERRWGIAVQLYGLRSPRNWGLGDFTDLKRLVQL